MRGRWLGVVGPGQHSLRAPIMVCCGDSGSLPPKVFGSQGRAVLATEKAGVESSHGVKSLSCSQAHGQSLSVGNSKGGGSPVSVASRRLGCFSPTQGGVLAHNAPLVPEGV